MSWLSWTLSVFSISSWTFCSRLFFGVGKIMFQAVFSSFNLSYRITGLFIASLSMLCWKSQYVTVHQLRSFFIWDLNKAIWRQLFWCKESYEWLQTFLDLFKISQIRLAIIVFAVPININQLSMSSGCFIHKLK